MVLWCWVNFQCRGVLLIWMSKARAYCACSRCGWGLFGHFFSPLSFLFLSPSLWDARYRLKYCLKWPLNPRQPTNQPKLSPDSTQFSKKCIFYQNFDRPWCTMVSIVFVSDSQQMKLYDYVEKVIGNKYVSGNAGWLVGLGLTAL